MVQEDLAISPGGLYESYFLYIILVVNIVKLQKNTYYKHDAVMSSENGSQIGVFRLPFRHHSHQEER